MTRDSGETVVADRRQMRRTNQSGAPADGSTIGGTCRRLSLVRPRSDLVSDATVSPRGRAGRLSGKFADGDQVFDIQQYDDADARRIDDQQLKQEQLLAAAAAERRRSVCGIAGLSREQLSEHYANCIRLNAENKISVKNAFSLQLIDCMADMLKRNDDDLNNFQVASATMDASAKIYGYRVDGLHGDTLRMAGGLGRTDERRRVASGVDGDNADDADDSDSGKNKKRKGRRRRTIEQNLANISVSSSSNSGCSSGAQQMQLLMSGGRHCSSSRGAADSSAASAAMFLATLPMHSDNQELIMHEARQPSERCTEADTAQHGQLHDELLQLIPGARELSDLHVCAPFASFSFLNWNLADDSMEEEGPSSGAPALAPAPLSKLNSKHRFDVNAIPEAIPEVDEDVYNDMGDGVCTAGDCDAPLSPPLFPARATCRPVADSTALMALVTNVPQEYSYFDKRRVQTWAGPKYWKLPGSSATSAAAARGHKTGEREARRRRERQIIDFDADVDFVALFATSRRAIKLKPITMKKWDEERTTLPEDLHYSLKSLFRTYLRPNIGFVCQLPADNNNNNDNNSVNMDDSVASYDYCNDNDANEYCPSVPAEVGGDQYDQDATFVPSGGATGTPWDATEIMSCTMVGATPSVAAASLFASNLVDAPKKIERIHISYAKTAKKVNMRRLKQTVWGILTESDDTKENVSDVTPDVKPTIAQCCSFSQMYRELHQRVSSRVSADLSVALALTALLHTANEHNLRLETSGNHAVSLADLSIYQTSSHRPQTTA